MNQRRKRVPSNGCGSLKKQKRDELPNDQILPHTPALVCIDSSHCDIQWFARANQSSSNAFVAHVDMSKAAPSMLITLTVEWQVDLAKCIDASPLVVVIRDRVFAFIGSHSKQFICVDMMGSCSKEKRVVWTHTLDDRIEASATLSRKHALVFVATYGGMVYAFCIHTGRPRWTRVVGNSKAIKASACVIESMELIILGSYAHNLYALDIVTGKCKWQRSVHGSVFSTPIVLSGEKYIVCVTTTGSITSWSLPHGLQMWQNTLLGPVFSSPVQTKHETIVVGCVDGHLYALNNSTGAILYSVAMCAPIVCTPCIFGDSILIGAYNGKLRKVSSIDGHTEWETDLNDNPPTADPIFASPYMFERGDPQLCLVATTRGRLLFCDSATGALVVCTGQLHDGEIFSSPVVIGNTIVVGTRGNQLYGLTIS